MVPLGSGSEREVNDYVLSRYACYLIVMNGNPRKEPIAAGQTYFATQTRKQELTEEYDQLSENQKRIAIRHELTEHNKSLADAAKMAGVETQLEYATFQNYGYMGLFAGARHIMRMLCGDSVHDHQNLRYSAHSLSLRALWAAI